VKLHAALQQDAFINLNIYGALVLKKISKDFSNKNTYNIVFPYVAPTAPWGPCT
jgi:hypothetical protein